MYLSLSQADSHVSVRCPHLHNCSQHLLFCRPSDISDRVAAFIRASASTANAPPEDMHQLIAATTLVETAAVACSPETQQQVAPMVAPLSISMPGATHPEAELGHVFEPEVVSATVVPVPVQAVPDIGALPDLPAIGANTVRDGPDYTTQWVSFCSRSFCFPTLR